MERTPPALASLLSTPSIVMLFNRACCPLKLRPGGRRCTLLRCAIGVTAGESSAKDRKFRPLIGKFSIWSLVTTVDTVRPRSRRGRSASTVSFSLLASHEQHHLHVDSRADREHDVFLDVWNKPGVLYRQGVKTGRQGGKRESAASSVVTDLVMLVAALTMETCAPRRIASVTSRTIPVTSAVVVPVWASPAAAGASASAKATTIANFRPMFIPWQRCDRLPVAQPLHGLSLATTLRVTLSAHAASYACMLT